jgi:PmbA protein
MKKQVITEDQVASLLKNNQIILSEVKKGEGKDCDVFSSMSSEMRVVFENKDFSLSTSHSTQMYGIRAIHNERLGFVTTNSDSQESLRDAAREALLVARLSAPNPHHKIADPVSETVHHQAVDPQLLEINPLKLGELAEQMVSQVLTDQRILVERAELSWSVNHWALSSSNDLQQTASATHLNWSIMGMAKSGEELTSFDYDGGMVQQMDEFAPKMNRTVFDFKDSVVGSLGARKGKSYNGPVVLHPEAVMDLIGGFFSYNAHGIRQQDGMSSWKNRRGEVVASPKLFVFEDPLNVDQPQGWSPFDREGVPTSQHVLIKNGVLNFTAHNCFSASREGIGSTGNATGGSRSLPGIGFLNLCIKSSDGSHSVSDEGLMKAFGTGLVVKRFSGNSDFTSGHFSGVAKNSWWMEKGVRSHPVTEVMISGHLFDLVKRVVEIGKESHRLGGGGMAPYIIVDGVSVTAT